MMLTEATNSRTGGAVKLPRSRAASTPLEDDTLNSSHWPAEVELILSALEAAGARGRRPGELKRCGRTRYRARAALRLFSDAPGAPSWLLYARDGNERGLGFITPHRLPLGYGGMIDLPAPGGDKRRIACTLLRCREVSSGWYEGALYFNRAQAEFAGG
jgi:hypothetical protein